MEALSIYKSFGDKFHSVYHADICQFWKFRPMPRSLEFFLPFGFFFTKLAEQNHGFLKPISEMVVER